MNSKKTRTEQDSLGKVEIPQNAYYGTTTSRARNNFQISGITAPIVFQEALGIVKLAAAKANIKLGLIPKKYEKALIHACEEFIDGKFKEEFTLDIFQAGAGTSYNMNANEVIANRANEILGAAKGTYQHLHPNDQVNMAQSTNDVIPTATRIAVLFSLPALLKEISELEKELSAKAHEGGKTLKVGRTHGQDAVPITVEQEFDSYKEAIQKSRQLIENQSEDLHILGIGGNAVGTGINAHPKFRSLIVENLTELTGIQFVSAKNLTEINNNMNSFLNFSAALRSLAINILNLCSDLKLLSMGPKAGLSEITLPAVQPGSSIMPGKINPSIPEAIEMVCLQVLGNDKTIEAASQKSQLELNVFCPIIMHNTLQSIEILTNGIRTLNKFCISGIKFNKAHIQELFEQSLCTATALVPHLGYKETADIVKTALAKNHSIKKEVLKRKLLSEKELEKILNS